MSTTNTKKPQVYSFGKENFSAFIPIDIKPVFGRNWVTNGINNVNFKTYQDAFDDSPTNNSIITAKSNYIFGEGLTDLFGADLSKYISQDDVELMVLDFEKFGGASAQIIWSLNKQPLRIEYLPIYKLGVNYDNETQEVNGYWYSYDWNQKWKYKPKLLPKFTGKYKGNNLEVIYFRKPTSETFFPIPSWLSGLRWAQIEGQISNAGYNHFKNGVGEITLINNNQGVFDDEKAAAEKADEQRNKVVGTDNNAVVIVSYNESAEYATTIDRIAPASLEQHNIFYSEEAERKLIVAHSAPPILFQGSNGGSGFSSNADEIAIAMKSLYRRHINPSRNSILRALQSVFDLIGDFKLDFKDFETEKKLDENADGGNALDDKTLEAQANLKGSVGGVQSLLEIQASYAQGLTTYDSAINMLDVIFGYNRETAVRLLGKPKLETNATINN
jgi:hypothetical protein